MSKSQKARHATKLARRADAVRQVDQIKIELDRIANGALDLSAAQRLQSLADRAYALAQKRPGEQGERSLAEEVGCSNFTVSVAVQALKIAYVSIANTSDLEAADAYDATMREMRAPNGRVTLLGETAGQDMVVSFNTHVQIQHPHGATETRSVKDYRLTRYAMSLALQNADARYEQLQRCTAVCARARGDKNTARERNAA
jgi:DNA-binding transcriptional MocR family regulator